MRKRLEMAWKIIADISSKAGFSMRMVYNVVTENLVELSVGVAVNVQGLDIDSKKSRIEAAIDSTSGSP